MPERDRTRYSGDHYCIDDERVEVQRYIEL
jgi:hypothetical protein